MLVIDYGADQNLSLARWPDAGYPDIFVPVLSVELRDAATAEIEAAFERGFKAGHAATNAKELDLLAEMNAAQKDVQGTLAKAFHPKVGAPSDKGVMGENLVANWIAGWFPASQITRVATAPHSADLVATLPNPDAIGVARAPPTVMIEVKNVAEVSTKDVQKFESDVRSAVGIDAAVFVSLRCGRIPNYGDLAVKRLDGKLAIYLGGDLERSGRELRYVLHMIRSFYYQVGFSGQPSGPLSGKAMAALAQCLESGVGYTKFVVTGAKTLLRTSRKCVEEAESVLKSLDALERHHVDTLARFYAAEAAKPVSPPGPSCSNPEFEEVLDSLVGGSTDAE